jgi:hypothetical protein
VLKLVEHLIEALLHILDAPISMPKELQRREEDLNLRRLDYWRNRLLLLLLLLEDRCIKPLCHLSTRCPSYPLS